MDAFFSAFWPNAAATLVGVVLGLPVALWVNRLAINRAARSTQESQIQRVRHALEVLIAAMGSNSTLLLEYVEVLAGSRVKWRLALDTSAWEAIKADFVAELTDPALRRRVAFHFSQLDLLRSLNSELLSFVAGTNASMSDANATRSSINETLRSMCTQLAAEATELISVAKTARQALGVSASGSPDA